VAVSIQARDYDRSLSENITAFSMKDPRHLYGGLVGTAREDGTGPSTAAYRIRVPSGCAYDVSVEYASDIPRPVMILLNGEQISLSALSEATGGFGSDKLVSKKVARRIALPEETTLVIKTSSSQAIPHLSRILLEPIR
jgi:hypothetical protein